ncbi:hypothetical protein DMUE_1148 [Dictyocoela muelleri]|nr:hypothetical protein DMUE_1148 [Dictyocoela muelleri]
MFYTDENYKILSNSEVSLGDATFYTAPRRYCQLYIIHGFYNIKYPHYVMLLWNIKSESYLDIFNNLKKKIIQSRKYLIVDFELAQYNAIQKSFPKTKLFGCYFHFTQIIIRHLQKFNFIITYTGYPTIKWTDFNIKWKDFNIKMERFQY